MVQIITLAGVKAAALKAHAEGRLVAQCGGVAYGYELSCDGKAYVCAIGACLTREALDKIEAQNLQCETMLSGLNQMRQIFDCSDAEFHRVTEIQSAHDAWDSVSNNGSKEANVTMKEAVFLSLLNA